MKTVNIHEAKTHFSKLLTELEQSGDSIVICRNGEPIADLVPHTWKDRVKPHPALSKMKIGYDPVEQLDDEEWPRAAR